MQDMTPAVGADAQVIQSYGPEGFRIGNIHYASHVLVMPNETRAWNGELTTEALASLWEAMSMPEILLVGTGTHHEMIAPQLRAALKQHTRSLDTMGTGAACRTFNILLSEGRRVAALLRLPG